MIKNLLIVSLMLIGINSYSQSSKTYPVFILNDSFSHAQPKDSKIIPRNYQLSSLKGFKIDCSNYDFSLMKSMNEGKVPDAIFIVANSGNYIVELNSSGETIVDNTIMHSLDSPQKKFQKFEKGDSPILGIGTLKIKDGAASMQTYWISMIDVK